MIDYFLHKADGYSSTVELEDNEDLIGVYGVRKDDVDGGRSICGLGFIVRVRHD